MLDLKGTIYKTKNGYVRMKLAVVSETSGEIIEFHDVSLKSTQTQILEALAELNHIDFKEIKENLE
jgi:hypothetical protein